MGCGLSKQEEWAEKQGQKGRDEKARGELQEKDKETEKNREDDKQRLCENAAEMGHSDPGEQQAGRGLPGGQRRAGSNTHTALAGVDIAKIQAAMAEYIPMDDRQRYGNLYKEVVEEAAVIRRGKSQMVQRLDFEHGEWKVCCQLENWENPETVYGALQDDLPGVKEEFIKAAREAECQRNQWTEVKTLWLARSLYIFRLP